MIASVQGEPGRALIDAARLGRLPKDTAEAGRRGEVRAAQAIEQWANRRPEPISVFHGVQVVGKDFDADHLIVVGALAIMVDTKHWKGGNYRFTPTPRGADVIRDGETFEGGTLSSAWEFQTWDNYLSNLMPGRPHLLTQILNIVPSSGQVVVEDGEVHKVLAITVSDDDLGNHLDVVMDTLVQQVPGFDPEDQTLVRRLMTMEVYRGVPERNLPQDVRLLTAPATYPNIASLPGRAAEPMKDSAILHPKRWAMIASWPVMMNAFHLEGMGVPSMLVIVVMVLALVAFLWGVTRKVHGLWWVWRIFLMLTVAFAFLHAVVVLN